MLCISICISSYTCSYKVVELLDKYSVSSCSRQSVNNCSRQSVHYIATACLHVHAIIHYTTRLTFSLASDEPGTEVTETSETDGE